MPDVFSSLSAISSDVLETLPYTSSAFSYATAPDDHPFIQKGIAYALEFGEQLNWSTTYYHTAILVDMNGIELGHGSVAQEHIRLGGCERVRLGSAPGQDYDLCSGCQTHNHSESQAIRMAQKQGFADRLSGSTLFLVGHFWCCQSCCNAMEAVGVERIVLMKEAPTALNRELPGSVLKPEDPQSLRGWLEGKNDYVKNNTPSRQHLEGGKN